MKFLLDHDVPVDVSYALVQMGHGVLGYLKFLTPPLRTAGYLNSLSKTVLS